MMLTGDGMAKPEKIAQENHISKGYYVGDKWHGSSTIEPGKDGITFESGWHMGHSTSIQEVLKIVKDGCAQPGEYIRGKNDCPAGRNGVYGFPLKLSFVHKLYLYFLLFRPAVPPPPLRARHPATPCDPRDTSVAATPRRPPAKLIYKKI